MPFDQLKQLSDLVGFCLAPHFLEVEEFGNAWNCAPRQCVYLSRFSQPRCGRQTLISITFA